MSYTSTKIQLKKILPKPGFAYAFSGEKVDSMGGSVGPSYAVCSFS